MRLLVALVLGIAGCAPIEQRPPEIRTTTVVAQTPIEKPCFQESDRPVLVITKVDPETATTEQLAAAELANATALADYAAAVDRLFTQCKGSNP